MRSTTPIHILTRAVLLAAAAAATALSVQAAPVPSPVGAAPAMVPVAAVAPSARTAAHDLPDAAVRNDYPWRTYAARYLNGDTVSARQCSGFALWRMDYRLRQPVNTTLARLARSYRMTGAKDLDNAAVRAGYRVDRRPAVGALAVWEAGAWGAGRYGHVAFVARVYADGTVLIEEYNGYHPLGYGTRRISARAVSHYLHLAHR